MSTIELFATSVAAGIGLGAMLGVLALRLWLAHLDRKDRDAMRAASRQLRNINDRTERLGWRAQHLGTPYIDRPGVRTVQGQPMYSSDWLNDGLGPAALPTELRSVR